jgi:hypothetical protein
MIQDIWEDLFHFSCLARVSAWEESNIVLVLYNDNENTALKLLLIIKSSIYFSLGSPNLL